MFDPETLGAAAIGLGVLAAGAFNGWQAVRARKVSEHAAAEATRAADNSHPVSNGFTAAVRLQLGEILRVATEARDQATQANDKIDRHLEAHANAAPTGPVVQLIREARP